MTSTMRAPSWLGRVLAGLVLLLGWAASASAANVLSKVSASTQGGDIVMQLQFAEPLSALPPGFAIDKPARIVLDFPGVSSGLGRSTVPFDQGNLRSVNVVEAQGRSRVVVNLNSATTYKMQIEGKRLLVLLSPVPTVASTATSGSTLSPAVHFAQNMNTSRVALRGIDFHRAADGAGQVVVQLPNNQVGVDLRQQGQNIVIDFINATLPADLQRRLDVGDFATPVQSVTAFQMGNNVRVVVQPHGSFQQSAY